MVTIKNSNIPIGYYKLSIGDIARRLIEACEFQAVVDSTIAISITIYHIGLSTINSSSSDGYISVIALVLDNY
jgi:hypothetical protein